MESGGRIEGMNTLKKVQLGEGHIKEYARFFQTLPYFNSFNETLDAQSPLSRWFGGALLQEEAVLVVLDDAPLFFLRCVPRGNQRVILSLTADRTLWSKVPEAPRFIQEEVLQQGEPKRSYTYHCLLNEWNIEVMRALNFGVSQWQRVMHRELAATKAPELGEGLRVRPVKTRQDFALRVRVQNEVFQNKNRIPLTLSEVLAQARFSSYNPDLALLLEQGDHPVGYGQIVHQGQQEVLVNFGIVPEARGQGFGRILLRELLHRAHRMEVTCVYLEVRGDNEAAIALYQEEGFSSLYESAVFLWPKSTEDASNEALFWAKNS
ncbi:hypothetical protein ABB02_01485 [Clostridiaceae bacterium JG1575]|nr:hypothetical protein ABB02_01485 [Clostridiaceae bacterium JG1575]